MSKAISTSMDVFKTGGARRLTLAVALGALSLALSGCVVYPSGYGYGYGGGYYAPSYYAPPVIIGGGWRGGWGRGGWR